LYQTRTRAKKAKKTETTQKKVKSPKRILDPPSSLEESKYKESLRLYLLN
jgi:hypothetical protein